MRAHDAEKNELKPWLRKQWVIPPQANAEFVCAMEDVLEVSTRPYDPTRPAVMGWSPLPNRHRTCQSGKRNHPLNERGDHDEDSRLGKLFTKREVVQKFYSI